MRLTRPHKAVCSNGLSNCTYNRTSLRVIRIREPVAAPAPRRALAEASFFSSPPFSFFSSSVSNTFVARNDRPRINSADVGTSWQLVRRRWLAWKAVAVNQGSQPSLIAPRIHYCAPPSYLTYPLHSPTLPIATASLSASLFVKTKLPVNKLCALGRGGIILSSRQHIFPRNVIPLVLSRGEIFPIHVREWSSLESILFSFFFFLKGSQKEREMFLRRTEKGMF